MDERFAAGVHLASDPRDIDIHHVGHGVPLTLPDLLAVHPSRDRLPGMLNQDLQHSKLCGREREFFPATRGPAVGEIDLKVFAGDQPPSGIGTRCGRRHTRAPLHGTVRKAFRTPLHQTLRPGPAS